MEAAPELTESLGPMLPGRGRRIVLLAVLAPWRRGPAATEPLLAVPPLVLLEPEVPEPVELGAAAAIPPLPAKRTPLAITHAPNTALT